jgi:ABC-type uncharacterized transport system substrate-binding protein
MQSSGTRPTLVAASQEELLIRRKSIAIMLKVLSYDKNLEQRSPESVRIGLFAKSTDADSVSCASLSAKALEAFKGKSLRGKKILAKAYFVDSLDQISALIEKNKLNVIYLSENLDSWVEPMARYAEKNKIPIIACDESYLKKGAALGVVKGKDDKPKILVNLKAAKAQGLALDARVLKIAEKVK